MFYAHFVLSKRGPLARIWLAAHWDKKLTKAHVFETNLEASVETIISPQVKMALRTSGHLLLGVVRIYNRKAKYLLADCNEAFVKIKMAFRPGVVDLPEESREAQHSQIYLVEEFHDFDTPLPDITDININRNLTLNQSRIEEITMPEEVPTTFQMDEGFGGGMMGFGKEVDQFSTGDLQNMFYKDDNRKVTEASKGLSFGIDSGEMKDRFAGDMAGGGMLDENFMEGPGLFGEGENFFGDDPPNRRDEVAAMDTTEDAGEEQPSPRPQHQGQELDIQQNTEEERQNYETVDTQHLQTNLEETTEQQTIVAEEEANNTTVNRDETTLVVNEEEAFALEPLDITGVKDVRIRRKRKLIVDQLMELDGQTMREQLKDFSDIVASLDMAPPTKRLMQWKEMGGVDKLFSNPSRVFSDFMNKVYLANLHLDIPPDLIDISGNQLQEQYGLADDEMMIDFDESSIQIPRADATDASINPIRISLDQSSILEAPKQTSDAHKGDVSATQPLAQPVVYNSDEDDYEPYSIGPPSVIPDLSPLRPPELPNNSALGDLSVDKSSTFPAPLADEPELGPPPEPLIDNSAEPGSPEEEIEESNEISQDDVEDLRWNKRTQHLMHTLDRLYKHHNQISFFQLTEGAPRKQAVSKFYSLLVLAKQEACKLHQSESFSDVFLQKGSKFESCLM